MEKRKISRSKMAAAGIMAAMIAVGGTTTYAWLYDRDSSRTEFELGQTNVVINVNSEEDLLLVPGSSFTYDADVTVSETNIPAYIFLESNVFNSLYLDAEIESGWSPLGAIRGVYYRPYYPGSSRGTYGIFVDDTITVDTNLTMEDVNNVTPADMAINIDAYIIQRSGFDDSSKSELENAMAAFLNIDR